MIARLRGIVLAVSLVVSVLVLASARPAAGVGAAPAATDPVVAYVDAAFELFVGRSATGGEHARWGPTVALGHRRALTRALAASDEWSGSRVEQLYRSVLGRPSDAGGRAHWVARIAEGHTLEAIAALLYGSDEYYAAGGSTPAGFVDRLYTGILGRRADDAGRRFWVARLAAGTSRSQVAGGFYASIESRSDRVAALYHEVLDRAPDRAGHDHWVGQVQHLGDVALASFLGSSDEQYRRATGAAPPPAPTRGAGTGFQAYATAGPIQLVHPVAAAELVGFHESQHDGGRQQHAVPSGVRAITLPTRDRGTGSRTAADIVVPPEEEVRAPVSGTVKSAGTYALYCRYRDDKVVIEPDSRPGWEVTVLHIDGVQVQAGDRVVAGITPLAPRATVLPFASQVDDHAGRPAWPHVHIEVVDPSIPDRPSGGC